MTHAEKLREIADEVFPKDFAPPGGFTDAHVKLLGAANKLRTLAASMEVTGGLVETLTNHAKHFRIFTGKTTTRDYSWISADFQKAATALQSQEAEIARLKDALALEKAMFKNMHEVATDEADLTARLTARAEAAESRCAELERERDQAEALAVKYVRSSAAMRTYAVHQSDCLGVMYAIDPDKCTCGLASLDGGKP